jgi:hypothetical protein
MCLVHKASDYDTAIQFLVSYTYDIVILDINGRRKVLWPKGLATGEFLLPPWK